MCGSRKRDLNKKGQIFNGDLEIKLSQTKCVCIPGSLSRIMLCWNYGTFIHNTPSLFFFAVLLTLIERPNLQYKMYKFRCVADNYAKQVFTRMETLMFSSVMVQMEQW